MDNKRTICVVTGTRADYGLLRPLIKRISEDPDVYFQLIATGMHLSPEFGSTYQEIEKDGFEITQKVDIELSSDTSVGIARSMGHGMMKFAEIYSRLTPDIIVGLGDRFELFSAVAAAFVSRIPFGHLSGGELTEGVLDDGFRHAITKLSHLHFTLSDECRNRVIQMGESPDTVFTVGEIGLDNIKDLQLLSKDELEEQIGFRFKKYNLLVTFHPLTIEKNTSSQYFQNLLSVLDTLSETSIIFTKANADIDGKIINKMIDEYVLGHPDSTIAFESMGRFKYLSAMKYSDAVVGNSSSGIIEAPTFRIGTINIGDRQKGRERAQSVIDCEATQNAIEVAFRKLFSHDFQRIVKNTVSPFGDKGGAQKVMGILKSCDLDTLFRKKFYDCTVTKELASVR